MRSAAEEAYSPAKHVHMLKRLWEVTRLGDEFAGISPCWRTLGFQQDDPSTDLRGCGALGLRQLLHFCERGGAHAVLAGAFRDDMVGFPLPVASLNVTLALCLHLQLVPATPSTRPCEHSTLRSFLRFSAEMEPARAIDLMHAELLRGLAELWLSMQRPGLTPIHLTPALHMMSEHLVQALAGAQSPWQASEVLQRLRSLGTRPEAIAAAAAASPCMGGWTWLGLVRGALS